MSLVMIVVCVYSFLSRVLHHSDAFDPTCHDAKLSHPASLPLNFSFFHDLLQFSLSHGIFKE